MTKINRSPIRYMGGKARLISRGLIDLFPKDINVFYDMFGGSGVVAMNTIANNHILNEKDDRVYSLYDYIKTTNPNTVTEGVISYMKKYDMPNYSTDIRRKGITKDVREQHKKNYNIMREELNKDLGPLEILTLMYFSMSTTIRFNKETGLFNMPCGNGYFNEKRHGQEIKNLHRFLNQRGTTIMNKDFFDIDINNINSEDFVYLDPPYLGSVATYNENGCWTKGDNLRLYKKIEELNEKSVRFGLSNIASNKNGVNNELLEWVATNGFSIYYFDDFDYTSFGRGNTKTVEVYIYNY